MNAGPETRYLSHSSVNREANVITAMMYKHYSPAKIAKAGKQIYNAVDACRRTKDLNMAGDSWNYGE